jgi:para-nitrobenzyl esterase
MKPEILTVVFCVLSLATANAALAEAQVDVSDRSRPTGQGWIEGYRDGDTLVFKGIPYARPPVGELRWRPPATVPAWNGLRQTTAFGPKCSQQGGAFNGQGEEDCLYLNVWAPDTKSVPADETARRPVMLWIHGGGLLFGSSTNAIFNSRKLAEAGNVVIVSFNYRLGVFGFLGLRELSVESQPQSSGAYGLLDQNAALKWVHDNIAAFGGDPDNITLFGESAGATSVCMHLAAPISRGLFQRAIIQSGPCLINQVSLEEHERRSRFIVDALGCTDSNDVSACLRAADVHDVIEANRDKTTGLPPGLNDESPTWSIEKGLPVDGVFMLKPFVQAIREGDVAEVPVMIGSVADEWYTFLNSSRDQLNKPGQYQLALSRRYGDRAAAVSSVYALENPDDTTAVLAAVVGADLINCPTEVVAGKLADHGRHIYLYSLQKKLDHLPEPLWGVFHTSDLAFVFGNDHWLAPLGEKDKLLSAKMMTYWTNFAKTGSPNSSDAPEWPRYDSSAGRYLRLDETVSADVNAGAENKCAFWKKFREW